MATQLGGGQWTAGFRLWRQSGRAGAAAWCARAELARREKADGQGSSSATSLNRTASHHAPQAAIAGRVMDATTSNAPDEEDLEDAEGPLGSSLELGDDPVTWSPSTSGAPQAVPFSSDVPCAPEEELNCAESQGFGLPTQCRALASPNCQPGSCSVLEPLARLSLEIRGCAAGVRKRDCPSQWQLACCNWSLCPTIGSVGL